MNSHITGIIASRRDVTADLWVVRVRPGTPVSFTPGQYFTIGLPAGGKLVERPYSVASAPHEPELEFFLEVVPEGKLTPQLYRAPVGSPVYIRPQARGRFLFDAEAPNHFMAATVTGVAPFVSMVRHLQALRPRPLYRVVILHAAGFPAELAYDQELAAAKGIEYIPTVSRPWLDPSWRGERGRVEDVARKYLDSLVLNPSDTTTYLCGNPHMIRNMQGLLERAGWETPRVRREIYFPAQAA